MTHKVKICAGCGAENDPGEVLCHQCQVMLPNTLTDSDKSFPPKPAMRLDIPADPRPRPTPAKESLSAPNTAPRKWTYETVPVRNGVNPLRVTVVDFDMSFWSLVQLMVKAAFAAIPAILIIILITTGMLAILGLFTAPFKG